jgi:hypothetical protein
MPSPSVLTERMKVHLAELQMHSQLRELGLSPGVNLCSNDYLGWRVTLV